MIDGTRAGDRALLYFSGHGGCVADQDGTATNPKDQALILHDTQLHGDGRLENALRDDEFRDLLQRLPGRHVLVLIDADHSGISLGGEEQNVAILSAGCLALMTQAGSVFTLGLHKVVNEVLSAGKENP